MRSSVTSPSPARPAAPRTAPRARLELALPAGPLAVDLAVAAVNAVLQRFEGLAREERSGLLSRLGQVAATTAAAEATLYIGLDDTSLDLALGDWYERMEVRYSSPSPLTETVTLGMELIIARQLMDAVHHERHAGENHWEMVRELPAAAAIEPLGFTLVLPADHRFVPVATACLERLLAECGDFDDRARTLYECQIALHEVATHIVQEGYRGGAGRIGIELALTDEPVGLRIRLRDSAPRTFDLQRSVGALFPAGGRGWLSGGALFFASATIVNLGNYAFNLIFGRWLGPAAFADLNLIVTLLLIFSFLATGFQQTAARFSAAAVASQSWLRLAELRGWMLRGALLFGSALALGIALGAPIWQRWFQSASPWPFVIIAAGLPFLLVQGVDRGILLGQTRFLTLAGSYQVEMWTRLFLAVAFVAVGWGVAGAVGALTLSLVATWWVARRAGDGLPRGDLVALLERRAVLGFAATVATAEIGLILINNSDVLLVKGFFTPIVAGHYAALALIGRVVFYATWSIVLAIFPVVAQRHERGDAHRHLLWGALGLVAPASLVVVFASWWVPERIVLLLFGSAYLPIAPLLWRYALATALFALANVVINYRLSLGHGGGTLFALGAGLMQVVLIATFHDSLTQVVTIQIALMATLLVLLLGWDRWLEVTAGRRSPSDGGGAIMTGHGR